MTSKALSLARAYEDWFLAKHLATPCVLCERDGRVPTIRHQLLVDAASIAYDLAVAEAHPARRAILEATR